MHKTVDSISLSLTKNIELKIEGDDIYLDMTTASMIKDSLMHIIQNSADHGIQKEGVIKIVLKEADGKMNIAVSDDGAGIDAEVIYQKSVEKGLIKAGTSGELQPEDKLQLIFLPGFSTKDVATEFSGRGVGMDVVKTNIGKLDGSVQIQSTLGEGTTFYITLPLNQ